MPNTTGVPACLFRRLVGSLLFGGTTNTTREDACAPQNFLRTVPTTCLIANAICSGRCPHGRRAHRGERIEVRPSGDTAAAMGILSSGFRAKIFFSLWWSVRSWLLSFPPNVCRGERCGVWGRRAPSDGVLVGFFWSVSSSSSGRAFFLLGQSAIRKRTHRGIGAYIMTYSGREEERAPSIYRSSSLVALSGGVEGAPFQRVFLRGLKSFSSRQSFSFDQRFS